MGGLVLHPGRLVWTGDGAAVGREQSGRRPWLVVSSMEFLRRSDDLVTVVPCTGRDRGWAHHIELRGDTGLRSQTFAVTEQIRTISRQRIVSVAGATDAESLTRALKWVTTWLHPAA